MTRQWRAGGVAALLALAGVSWAMHDPIADGPAPAYVKGLVVAAGIAGLLWSLLALQFGRRSWVPLAAAILVLGAVTALRIWRAANPLIHGQPAISFAATFRDLATVARQWELRTSGAGSITAQSGALRLTSKPDGAAQVVAKLPPLPASLLPGSLRTPVALSQLRRVDEITWRAAITRTEPYAGIFQSRRFDVQAVRHGLLLTFPDERGDVSAAAVNELWPIDGQPHTWKIRGDGESLTLLVDGQVLWTAPQREPLDEVKLGEGRSDREHGGEIVLYEVTYVRRYVRPATEERPTSR